MGEKSDVNLNDLGLDVEPVPEKGKGKDAAPAKARYHKGKVEYAGPFYTLNISHVEHMPEFEVISVNGEAIQIRRGEDVPNIPHAFVQVLKNAIASRQVKSRTSEGVEFFEWRDYPAIPFQIVAGPYNERKTP